jgi:hypothetical protein
MPDEERMWPPFPNVFSPDAEMLTPRDIRKYGYRLKRGMTYRLYSLAEIRDRIKDGTIVPIKGGPKKPVFEETRKPPVPPPSVPKETPEERAAKMSEFRKKMDKFVGPSVITDAIERWNIKQGKKGALFDSDKIRVRRILRYYAVSLEWDEKNGKIKFVLNERPEAERPPGPYMDL